MDGDKIDGLEKRKKNLRYGGFAEDPEWAREAGRRSGEARRRKISMKDAIIKILNNDFQDEKTKIKLAQTLGIEVEDMDNQMAILSVVCLKALKGDMNAVKFIQEVSGNKAIERIEISKPVVETSKEIEDFLSKRDSDD